MGRGVVPETHIVQGKKECESFLSMVLGRGGWLNYVSFRLRMDMRPGIHLALSNATGRRQSGTDDIVADAV